MSILYAGIFPEKVDKMVCLDIVRPTPTIPETVGYRLRKTVSLTIIYWVRYVLSYLKQSQ